jgi:hypothetical protein
VCECLRGGQRDSGCDVQVGQFLVALTEWGQKHPGNAWGAEPSCLGWAGQQRNVVSASSPESVSMFADRPFAEAAGADAMSSGSGRSAMSSFAFQGRQPSSEESMPAVSRSAAESLRGSQPSGHEGLASPHAAAARRDSWEGSWQSALAEGSGQAAWKHWWEGRDDGVHMQQARRGDDVAAVPLSPQPLAEGSRTNSRVFAVGPSDEDGAVDGTAAVHVESGLASPSRSEADLMRCS